MEKERKVRLLRRTFGGNISRNSLEVIARSLNVSSDIYKKKKNKKDKKDKKSYKQKIRFRKCNKWKMSELLLPDSLSVLSKNFLQPSASPYFFFPYVKLTHDVFFLPVTLPFCEKVQSFVNMSRECVNNEQVSVALDQMSCPNLFTAVMNSQLFYPTMVSNSIHFINDFEGQRECPSVVVNE
jgi:hypothetical protein